MIPKGLFAQIGMVVVSIAIIITYVEPAFSQIGEVQDNIAVYRQEREKVSLVNGTLDSLLQTQKSVSITDQNKLMTYMPDEESIDVIAVPRDLAIIAVQAGVIYRNAGYTGGNNASAQSNQDADASMQEPKKFTFNYAVEGSYNQLKTLFRLLEQNHYPLEVTELSIDKIDGGFLSVTMELTTYAYQDALPANQLVF